MEDEPTCTQRDEDAGIDRGVDRGRDDGRRGDGRWLRDVEGFEGLLVLTNVEAGTTHVDGVLGERGGRRAAAASPGRSSGTGSRRRSNVEVRSTESYDVAFAALAREDRARPSDAQLLGQMLRYALARSVWTIPVVLIAVTLTFFLVRSIGGDPFRHGPLVGLTGQGGWQKYGDYQPQSIRDNMRRRYGLDLPWYEQYGNYLVGVATLNLGPSLSFRNRTVEEIIAQQGPVTLELALLALGLAFALGIPIGLLSALHPRSAVASLERVSSSLALSLPAFLVGTILIYVFAVRADLVPTTGWDSWSAKILPVVTLSLVPLAYCVRLTRAAVLETLTHDYVRTARAKGLRRRQVARPARAAQLARTRAERGRPAPRGDDDDALRRRGRVRGPRARPALRLGDDGERLPAADGDDRRADLFVITANLLVDLALAALDPRLRAD